MNLADFKQTSPFELMMQDNVELIRKVSINSLNSRFEIQYISNLRINGNFPLIKMTLIQPVVASYSWIQIIRTDNESHSFFVDGKAHYPLFSRSKSFYKAPYYEYTLRKKPISYWLSHTYCVIADENHNVLQCLGGVRWGFVFRYPLSWSPKMIKPKALTVEQWIKDYTDYLGYLEMYPQRNHSTSPYSRGRI